MSNEEFSNEQKLEIINDKIVEISMIIKIVTDALSFRLDNDNSENFYDCVIFLRRVKDEIEQIKNLY